MAGKPRTVSVETMRRSDAYTISNFVSSKELMQRAGKGIFDSASMEMKPDGWKEPVAIACGKGNNAGDGYVVASLLHREGIDCTIVLADRDRFSDDGRYYFDKCCREGIPVQVFGDGISDFAQFNTIVDALLGTGFKGDVQGIIGDMINAINLRGEQGAYVISADFNSGLNGDTGLGTTYVKSDLTVSIGEFKHGHFKGLANEAMKAKVNCDIGIIIV